MRHKFSSLLSDAVNVKSALLLSLIVLMSSGILYHSVSALAANQMNIDVNLYQQGCALSQQVTTIGQYQTFSVTYYIYNGDPIPYNIGLGLTLTSTSGNPVNDQAHDEVVNVVAGGPGIWDQPFTRLFNPNGARPGTYSLTCAIWLGQPGYGQWLDSRTYPNIIVIT
ncbi:MAG: hypothetical protein WB661_09400 [Candidatus Bathyarchaeia archaeon]